MSGKVRVELAHVVLGGEDWLEGRVEPPTDDVGPGDVTEESVRLDGISVAGSAAQSLTDLPLQKFPVDEKNEILLKISSRGYLMRSLASGVR